MIIKTEKGYFVNFTPDFWDETPLFSLKKDKAKIFNNKIIIEHVKYILETEHEINNCIIIN